MLSYLLKSAVKGGNGFYRNLDVCLCNSTPSIVYVVQRDGSFEAVDYLWVNNKASKTLVIVVST